MAAAPKDRSATRYPPLCPKAASILPRVIRLRDAPGYLGMDKNRFNREVRPHVREKRMGQQGVAFDRLELDAWADRYFGCNGRSEQQEELWNVPNCRGYPKASSGGRKMTSPASTSSKSILRSNTGTGQFVALAERMIRKRQQEGFAKS